MNNKHFQDLSKLELINIIENQKKRLEALTKENELWHELELKKKHIKGLLTDIDKTEKKYKNVLLDFPLPIIIYKKTGEITFMSKTTEEFVGYKLEEIKNYAHLFELIYPNAVIREQSTRKWRNSLLEYERGIISLIYLTNKIQCKTGEEKYCSFYAVKFEEDLLVVLVDLTDKKKIENKLIEATEKANKANRAKTNFFANMTHEIKTPMNAILGFSQILEQTLTDEKEKYYINSIKTAGMNLMKLIDDLLDFSKLDSDILPLNYGKTFLLEIVSEMKEFFALKIREKNMKFIIEVEKNLPDVYILDEARIRQVLFNLLNNSIQNTNKGYVKVTVKGTLKPDCNIDIVITIEDSSVGGGKETLEALSNYSIGDSKTLGLNISKRLIEKMKGTLEAVCVVKTGNIFTIRLNNIKYTEEVRKKVDYISGAIEFKQEKILVVDDTKLNLEVVSDLLRNENLKILTARSGEEGLEILKNNEIDLIFLDLKMPKMSGYEALEKIREMKKNIKVIALTASSESSAQILTHGFDAIIKKPFVRRELIDQLVRQLYGNKQLRKSFFFDNVDEYTEDELKMDGLLLPKDEIVFFLENELEKAWVSAIEYEDVDEIKEFADRVHNYASKIHFQALMEYAEELKLNTRTFNIKGIRKNLNYFGTFIEKFKRQD